VDRLDRVSRKYNLLFNVDKTKVMASDGIACRILIQNEQLRQVVLRYFGSLITEDGECTTEFRTRLNKEQAIGASLQKIWKSHSIPISTWTGLSVEESVRMTQDRDKWRKYVHGVANPRIEDG